MSRSIHRRAHRTGLVSADIFRPGVDDLNQLMNLAPNDIWDGTLIHVRDLNGIYAYDLESVAVDDGLTVITPATAVGRWLQIGFGGTSSATSGTADKWIDVTKITASETITVDVSLASDWPQEVRRDTIDVDGVLDIVDGYVLSGDYPLEITGQTQGDVLYFDGSSWVRLAAGTVGEVLQTGGAGANPTWEARPALLDRHHINMPAAPGATVKYRGWSDGASRLTKAKFYHGTASTAGVIYTLAITNETNGTSLLAGATEDLLVLAGSSVTLLGLTAATGDLTFAENDQWEITIVMDVNINATDIYVDLVFESI